MREFVDDSNTLGPGGLGNENDEVAWHLNHYNKCRAYRNDGFVNTPNWFPVPSVLKKHHIIIVDNWTAMVKPAPTLIDRVRISIIMWWLSIKSPSKPNSQLPF